MHSNQNNWGGSRPGSGRKSYAEKGLEKNKIVGVSLDTQTRFKLEVLANKTGQTKSFIARFAIDQLNLASIPIKAKKE